jgi:hypothetical protein
MRHFIPAAALAAALALAAPLATPAFAADPGVKIGLLTCKSTGESGGIITTETRFACVYDGAGGEVTEHYTGEISKIGLDLTTEQDVTLVWAVVAPSATTYAPNALSGTYVGASASAALGLGAGARVLVGGGDQSFTLQPVSVEGIEGTGVSLGIESFELHS